MYRGASYVSWTAVVTTGSTTCTEEAFVRGDVPDSMGRLKTTESHTKTKDTESHNKTKDRIAH